MKPEELFESFIDFYKSALEEAEGEEGTTIGQKAILLNESSSDQNLRSVKDKYTTYFADHRRTPKLDDDEEEAARTFNGKDLAINTAKSKISMEDNEKQFWVNAIKASTNEKAKEYAEDKLDRLQPENEALVDSEGKILIEDDLEEAAGIAEYKTPAAINFFDKLLDKVAN